jgi:uncharacterized membrane protein YgdD (TMEM256/DUF423 family)
VEVVAFRMRVQPGLVSSQPCVNLTPMTYRATLRASGILGALGVGLGAFGAHALEDLLMSRGMTETWKTGVSYHLLHTVALLGVGVWMRSEESVQRCCLRWVPAAWILGVVLFSGSIYGIALGGPRWLGPVTPLGGLSLIAGWVLVAVAALNPKGTVNGTT